MNYDIHKQHSEVVHYTTAIGLRGILESGSMWATHSGYVNDSGECRAFYKHKLPSLIHGCADALRVAGHIVSPESIERLIKVMSEEIPSIFGEAYLISFCGSANHGMNDGLLSQWRGYGSDGGYAIVLDTYLLNRMLLEEHKETHLGMVRICEVEYSAPASQFEYKSPEMKKCETDFSEAIKGYLLTQDIEHIKDSALPTILMSVTHKHAGFSEEQEVRIVVIPVKDKFLDKLGEDKRSAKALLKESFYNRNGLLVPHLTLFRGKKLPIKRVIVGPHHDAERRKASVKKLLLSNGYDVDVTASAIPFIGR